MEKIDRTYTFKGHDIHVFKGDESDLNWNEEITIKLSSVGKDGTLILHPLWNLNSEYAEAKEYKNKYLAGDYYQQTFTTNPKGSGLGAVIHDFLIENMNDLKIANVYSTNNAEDGHLISQDAKSFWDNRATQGKAFYEAHLERYRIYYEDVELCKNVEFRTMNTRQKEQFYEIFVQEIINDDYVQKHKPLRFKLYGSPNSNKIPINCYSGKRLVRFYVIDFFNQEYLPECTGINGTPVRFCLNCEMDKWPPKIFYCLNEALTKEFNDLYGK